jgi:hypothetical protein
MFTFMLNMLNMFPNTLRHIKYCVLCYVLNSNKISNKIIKQDLILDEHYAILHLTYLNY